MDNLHIEGDLKNPTLNFDYDAGTISIKGRSWPEHAVNVYQPAFDWLEDYKKSPQAKTTFKVELEYFNTSSSKVVLQIMQKAAEMHKSGMDVKVEWYYENDDFDLKEEGETFAEMVDVPVEMVGIEEFDFTFDRPS